MDHLMQRIDINHDGVIQLTGVVAAGTTHLRDTFRCGSAARRMARGING